MDYLDDQSFWWAAQPRLKAHELGITATPSASKGKPMLFAIVQPEMPAPGDQSPMIATQFAAHSVAIS